MDGPTIVYVNTMIRSISKIDDYKMVSTSYFGYAGHIIQGPIVISEKVSNKVHSKLPL